MKTRTKLISGFAFLIASIIVIVTISFNSIRELNKSHDDIISHDELANFLIDLRSNQYKLKALSLELMIAKSPTVKEEIKKQIEQLTIDVKNLFGKIEKSIGDSTELDLFKKIEADVILFGENTQKYNLLIAQNKTEEAELFESSIQTPHYVSLRTNILQLEDMVRQSIRSLTDKNDKITKRVDITLIILSLSLIALSLFMAYSMLNMIRRVAEEIRSSVEVLGSSASEILTTVTEIYTGAAETATAVSETTTTVEEVRQTAMVSNQKAQSLMLSSQKAADSAEKGREAINEVIESMKKIDSQMTIISETIVRLADQSRTIGEITSTVSDIADQSNLLAVNAAIEAAKAAEHGRGFTVVAQEIRSLADQSKKATVQVKEILNEINKSVNQAVGVTDLGARTVNDGKKLVSLCGTAIDILSDNVEEATQSSIQISSSNQQQMAGMEQIVPAMENIKQASEQNVNGIKQTQAAANSLTQLGHDLQEVIKKFNL